MSWTQKVIAELQNFHQNCHVCSSPPDRVAVIAYHANTWRRMRSCSLFLELDQIECSRRLNSVVVVVFVFG